MSQIAQSKKVKLHKPVELCVPFEIVRGADGQPDDEKRIIKGRFYKNARVANDPWNLPLEAVKRAAPAFMKSPCIRAMHQPIAAGKALDLEFPAGDGGYVTAYIGDDQEWRKCKDGIYRELSVRFRPMVYRGYDVEDGEIVEISLVDRGKDPDCQFWIARGGDIADGEEFEVEIFPTDDVTVDDIARGLTSTEVPIRENLEGPCPDTGKPVGECDCERCSTMRGEGEPTTVEDIETGAVPITGTPSGAQPEDEPQRADDAHGADIARIESLTNELEISRADIARMEGEISRLQGELSTSQATVERLNSDVQRLELDNSTKDNEIARLRETPAPQAPTVFASAVPQSIERVFAANDLLTPAGINRAKVQERKEALLAEAKQTDLSQERRNQIATEIARCDIALNHG